MLLTTAKLSKVTTIYQLFQLTKLPGGRPIGIGKFLRQTMVKVVHSLKVCAGQDVAK